MAAALPEPLPGPAWLWFGPSRFSDPETTLVPPERFGVVYFGSSIKVCFVEVILRDRGVARLTITHIFESECRSRCDIDESR